MRIEDLMVGDWVICTYPSINKPVKVMEIKTVSDEELKAVINNDGIRLVFRRTYIDPIPLTPEILEKNVFEKVPQEKCVNPFYWRFDKIEDGEYNYSVVAYKTPFRGFFFEIKNNCDCEPIVFTKQMESVHELQHALRICGITKEIQI